MSDAGLEARDGVEAKTVIREQLAAALQFIGQHHPARITTLGGECSVSVAPFSELARRYGDDLAILWIDSHPDVGTPKCEYPGYHAMAVAAITGHGDNAMPWRRTSQRPIRSAHAAGASSSTAVSGAGPIAPLTVRAASMAAGVPSSTIPSCLNA